MRLKPRTLGSDYSLDEYNATQYLLYHQNCWNEYIELNNNTPYNGDYANYQLYDPNNLLSIDKTGYLINNTIQANDKLYLNLGDPINTNCNYWITLYYNAPVYDNNGTLINDPDSAPEYNEDTITNTLEQVDIYPPRDYKAYTIQANKINEYQLEIPLNPNIFIKGTIISKITQINLSFTDKPYIDVNNGKSNNLDEILLDNNLELSKMIQKAPTTGEKTIYRLDSTNKYSMLNTLIIENGMNIELRGGTNTNALLSGTYSKRLFIIKPGGHLVLSNITLKDCDATQSNYKTGNGGAVLIESSRSDKETIFGVLEANNCIFINNHAINGGSIYTQNTGLYVNNTDFYNCNCDNLGGAVYYYSDIVNILFNNIKAERGDTITLNINITNKNDGSNVNTGQVTYLINEKPISAPIKVTNGNAQLNYQIPNNTGSQFNIKALYSGDNDMEGITVQNTVFVKENDKINVNMSNDLYIGHANSSIQITAIVTDMNGQPYTLKQGIFTINGVDYNANIKNNTYTINYAIPKNTQKETLPVTFNIPNTTQKGYNTSTLYITNNINGIFVNNMDITTTTINNWITNNVTDVYVRVNIESSTVQTTITNILKNTINTDIKVHAVIDCYHNDNGFINPTDTTRINIITAGINNLIKNYPNLDGICLDYIRYATSTSDINKHTTITNNVKTIVNYINSLDDDYIITCCTMPEDNTSKMVYGQDFDELAQIVDYQLLMVYKGNYKTNDTWIGARIAYATGTARNKSNTIVGVLQTYNSDTDLTLRTKADLEASIKQIKTNNAVGCCLFREGLIKTNPTPYRSI